LRSEPAVQLARPDYVILIVTDLDESLEFYTQVLGLRLGHRTEAYTQLETGATRSGLYTREAMAKTLGTPLATPAPDAPGFQIGFKVPDVDAAYRELLGRGGIPQIPPLDRPWDQRIAYLGDPDGHLIELIQDTA
jgi:lactoylglutathione lyase